MEALARLDLKSPFVTVAVDSQRINATLEAIVAQLGYLAGSIAKVESASADHGRGIDALRGTTAKHTTDISQLYTDLAGIREIETRMSTVERNIETRLQVVAGDIKVGAARTTEVEKRINDLEKQRAQERSAMDQALANAARLAEDARAAANQFERRLAEMRAEVDSAVAKASDADGRTTTLAAVFNIDMTAARGAVEAGSRVDATSGLEKTVQYCRSLPAFSTLEAASRRHAIEEAANVKALLTTKADAAAVHRLEDQLAGFKSAIKNNADAIDRVSKDVEARVPRSIHKADIERLQNVKADRSELVGMVSHEDLRGVQSAMVELRAYVERVLADFQLEARENRNRDNAAALKSGGGHAAAGAAEFSDLCDRVKELERQAKTLFDVKADRSELEALQAYIDNVLANINAKLAQANLKQSGRPGSGRRSNATPPLVEADTPRGRGRLLSPISRLTSQPQEPLYYTSLPIRPESPSDRSVGGAHERSGASTAVYDTNGNRTSALLSHGVAVPAAEHMLNMGRAASGQTVVPSGYVVHDIAELERPRSAAA